MATSLGAGQVKPIKTAVHQYETVANRRFYARTLSNQKVKTTIACGRLNRMASLGVPISIGIK
jgi:hypothetical protein